MLEFTLVVKRDGYPDNPREAFDHLGTIVCWHSRYNLGDDQPNNSPEEWLTYLFLEYATDQEKRAQVSQYFNGMPLSECKEFLAYYDNDLNCLIEKEIEVTAFPESVIALPIYMYEHGGITISTDQFSCMWDSGQIGYIYVTREKLEKETTLAESPREQIEKYLIGEVEEYDAYLTGEVYGWQIETTDGDILESCWGYYNESEAQHQGMETLKYFDDQYEKTAALDSAQL